MKRFPWMPFYIFAATAIPLLTLQITWQLAEQFVTHAVDPKLLLTACRLFPLAAALSVWQVWYEEYYLIPRYSAAYRRRVGLPVD
ncbi:hypothetical protein SAMN05192563_10436 [Paraburkholderia aspalathi]|uniref:Uncharacterized protein n=1 Tax=Paraburkholderia aspalathi TaxID=1324617 RepID=A0A1I7EPM0_9BURK|nr:hypothetical protein SAMN05192563_10436 [Paraburkholderia aspalathi]